MKISVQPKRQPRNASSRGRVPQGHAALPLNVIATRKSRTDHPSSANVIRSLWRKWKHRSPLPGACAQGRTTAGLSTGKLVSIPMKSFLKYQNLTALVAVILLAVSSVLFLGFSPVSALALLGLFQLSQFALSHQQAALFTSGVTPAQIREFQEVIEELKGGWSEIQQALPDLKTMLKEFPDLKGNLQKLRKTIGANAGNGTGVRWMGGQPYVSDECALFLSSSFVIDCESAVKGQRSALTELVRDNAARERVLSVAKSTLGIQQRTALTGTEIPLPTQYMAQVVELIFAFGQARRFATLFPLGAGTVKLPRNKAGEDDFGYLGAGTAGMSQAVPEKRPATELVTFTANKAGGLIRIPFEIEEDTMVALGQFLARYIARQFAKLEDNTLFNADGTSTYASQKGVAQYCTENPAYLLQLGAGKTKPSDATLDNFRALRAKVSPAVIANMAAGGETAAAYYLHPTWEAKLTAFNTYPNFIVFKNEGGRATLDGWPIRWIGVSESYKETASASAAIAFFGDLSFWYLGERGTPRIEMSREVFFATDELALRALERIDVQALAVDAMATLKTAAV